MNMYGHLEHEVELCLADPRRRVWFITENRYDFSELSHRVRVRKLTKQVKVSMMTGRDMCYTDEFINKHNGYLFSETYCDVDFSNHITCISEFDQGKLTWFIGERTDYGRGKVHAVKSRYVHYKAFW